MKFVVGVMLTAFGIFWGAEGAGAHWPGEDVALLVLIPAIALYAIAAGCRVQTPEAPRLPTPKPAQGFGRFGVYASFARSARFWYDFIVGDDWRVALVVALALAVTTAVNRLTDAAVWWIVVVAVSAALPLSIYRVTRPRP